MKYNAISLCGGREGGFFTIRIVSYLLHSYPVECYFAKKSSYLSSPFFFFSARMISKRAVSSKEKWKSCHLHASPDINNSLSMFTTYIRWHCYSWRFYYRRRIWRQKCLAQRSLIAWFCINYVSYREFELFFTSLNSSFLYGQEDSASIPLAKGKALT